MATLLTHCWASRRSVSWIATQSAQRSRTCTTGMEGVEQHRCGECAVVHSQWSVPAMWTVIVWKTSHMTLQMLTCRWLSSELAAAEAAGDRVLVAAHHQVGPGEAEGWRGNES